MRVNHDVKEERVGFRANPKDKERWREAARAQRRSLSNWVTIACNAYARERLEPPREEAFAAIKALGTVSGTRSDRVVIRARTAEVAKWTKAARFNDRTLSVWMTWACDLAAAEQLTPFRYIHGRIKRQARRSTQRTSHT
jgi:uncharacterized protein (DUF1778 family)